MTRHIPPLLSLPPHQALSYRTAMIAYFLMTLAVAWTMLLSLFVIGLSFISHAASHRMARVWGQGVCWIFGIEVHSEDVHHLPPNGGYILAPNHQSAFDMPILCTLPTQLKWVAKVQAGRIPFLGWALRSIGCYFVSRKNTQGDIDVLREVERGLQNGDHVVMFPEGTRTRDGKPLPLKKGPFRTAQNAAVPLVPVGLWGSFDIAPPYQLPKQRGHKVVVRVGRPVFPLPNEPVEGFMERYRTSWLQLLEAG